MVFQTALRSLSNRSKVVVGNYCSSPITAEQYREKARPLRPRRSYFAPAETQARPELWWRRRVPPPGPMGLFRWPFIAIADLAAGIANIRAEGAIWKSISAIQRANSQGLPSDETLVTDTQHAPAVLAVHCVGIVKQ